MITLKVAQIQRISFIMVNSSGAPMPGLVPGDLTVTVSAAGAAFVPGAGSTGVIGSGWYYYDLTAAETSTEGPLAITITSPGCANQNLLFFIQSPTITARKFIYTLRDNATHVPITGAEVWASSDNLGQIEIDHGFTDGTGKVTFFLNPGTYYLWKTRAGYSFTNPEEQVIPA